MSRARMAICRGSVPRPAGRRAAVYPQEELWRELTYLAYHLHWELETLLSLEHGDRARLLEQVAELNERAWQEVEAHG